MKIVEQIRSEADERELIARHLRASNLERMPRIKDSFYHAFYLMDEAGDVAGGLWAQRTFDWVFVDLLFVPETLRGQGVGADLLTRIEAQARDWGAKGVWLDTYGFQARPFYEKHGYTCFATLEGAEADADKHFLRKYLS